MSAFSRLCFTRPHYARHVFSVISKKLQSAFKSLHFWKCLQKSLFLVKYSALAFSIFSVSTIDENAYKSTLLNPKHICVEQPISGIMSITKNRGSWGNYFDRTDSIGGSINLLAGWSYSMNSEGYGNKHWFTTTLLSYPGSRLTSLPDSAIGLWLQQEKMAKRVCHRVTTEKVHTGIPPSNRSALPVSQSQN